MKDAIVHKKAGTAGEISAYMYADRVKPTLCDAVLLTLCYREVFAYPLKRFELQRYLLLTPADACSLDRALAQMNGSYITLQGDYVLPVGAESLVDIREARERASVHYWRWALRYARWLRWVPFVRMVAVTGSLAVNNADASADIDIFCVTVPGRMWLARFGMAFIKRISRRYASVPACLNTCLSEAELQLPDPNLYIAHQMALMVPIWGEAVYQRLVDANLWVHDYFPQLNLHEQEAIAEQAQPRWVRYAERLLAGRVGTWLNRRIYLRGTRNAMQGIRDARQQKRKTQPGDAAAVDHSRQLEHFWMLNSHMHEIQQRFAQCWRERAAERHTVYDLTRLFGSGFVKQPHLERSATSTQAEQHARYYQSVGRYFDEDAATFSNRYFGNRTLQRMRGAFRDATRRYPFQNVLEIGVGPGLDLAYWARERPDAHFAGLDISPGMIAESERRIRAAELTNVRCAVGSVEDVFLHFPGQRYDLVYVYFGALNTVADLRVAARAIHGCMQDDGIAVITFVNRWFMEDIMFYLLTFRWRRAFARWRSVWGGYANNRFLASRCYSPFQVRRAFGPMLRVVHTEGFCILHPAWHRDKWVRRFPRLCNFLWRCDRILSRTTLWCFGEYALYVFEPRQYVSDGRLQGTEVQRACTKKCIVP